MSYRTAPVLSYTAPTRLNPGAVVQVGCPFGCQPRRRNGRPITDKATGQPRTLTHGHGVGAAGTAPVLGARSAHCADHGGSYELVDPFGLVPDRLEIA